MADDLITRGGQGRSRIDLNEDFEVREWSQRFGVTVDEVREAVAAVGNEASKVEEHLQGRTT